MEKINKHKSFIDDRGYLLPIEFSSLSFIPQRAFVVNDVPVGEIRGCHSHYETQQFLICINGSIEVILHDGKEETKTIIGKSESLLIPNFIWDSQCFLEKNSELLVLCSTKYNIDDYILDFEMFKKIKNNIN